MPVIACQSRPCTSSADTGAAARSRLRSCRPPCQLRPGSHASDHKRVSNVPSQSLPATNRVPLRPRNTQAACLWRARRRRRAAEGGGCGRPCPPGIGAPTVRPFAHGTACDAKPAVRGSTLRVSSAIRWQSLNRPFAHGTCDAKPAGMWRAPAQAAPRPWLWPESGRNGGGRRSPATN